ncbi:MAG: DUF2189 domain-containing protein [Kiloniellales bacterium]|nr:DUF2189 domain-containing protein [Kiloniellales bacterium]
MATIRNPIEWGADQFRRATQHAGSTGRALRGSAAETAAGPLTVRRIGLADLGEVLRKGLADFAAYRTDVVFLCLIYPVIGLVLARLAFDHDLLPLLFPVVSGFALLGPVAAVGLYEMSRQREQGVVGSWTKAFGVIGAPAFGAIVVLGLMLLAVFLLWLVTAQVIYLYTLGPEPPASAAAFLGEVIGTKAGWTMIGVGIGVGFLFALLVLATSVISFPLLLDRDVGIWTAIETSARVTAANPLPIAAWGVIVAAGLLIGSLPLFLGLVVVLPVLGHATWHLYRRTVAP